MANVWPSNVDKHSIEGQPTVRLCNYTDAYKNDVISESLEFMRATATPEQIARFRLNVGDTIITKDSETASDIGVPSFVAYEARDLICGYHLAIVRPDRRQADPRFLYWALASPYVLRQWEVLASGVTRVALRSGDLQRVQIPQPPLAQQRAIADYLDRETAPIDTLIAKQEQLIATLRERRVIIADDTVAERVGRGVRLKRSITEVDHRAGHVSDDLPLLSVSIAWGVRRRDEASAERPRADDLSIYKIANAGEIVINRMRAFQGALGVAPVTGVVSPDYAVLRCPSAVVPAWLATVMRSTPFVAEMSQRLKGIGGTESGLVRTPRINISDLLDIAIDTPPLGTQHVDLARIKKETARINALISKAEQFIALSRERRAALITAAVTGQIDVSTAA